MGYYDIAESCLEDHIVMNKFKVIVEEMGSTVEKINNMIYEKLNPIITTVKTEYQQTDEYKTNKEHQVILKT